MAVFTELPPHEAQRVSLAHSLGAVSGIDPIAAGSVNSNFFLSTQRGRYFLRIYEEQETEGVAYEWRLLAHLEERGIPAPRRVAGPGPGELRVGGKPVAIFHVVGGEQSCQAAVSGERARAVGAFLGRAHVGAASFEIRREGRFREIDVERRLRRVDLAAHPELTETVTTIRTAMAATPDWSRALPRGVVHGDLFRDNVHWEGNDIVAALDWESASDGILIYDLAVALLAWCYDDRFRWDLASAMVAGYQSVRELTEDERNAFVHALISAACRFTTTRITDFYLRQGEGQSLYKDYRRFLARLEAFKDMPPEELGRRLGL